MKVKQEPNVVKAERETVDAYLRLTGRAFESGAAHLFTAAQALVMPESVEQYCERIVREQITLRTPKKMYPDVTTGYKASATR